MDGTTVQTKTGECLLVNVKLMNGTEITQEIYGEFQELQKLAQEIMEEYHQKGEFLSGSTTLSKKRILQGKQN